MKIGSSNIALSSDHSLRQTTQESKQLRLGQAAIDNINAAKPSLIDISATGKSLLAEANKQVIDTANASTSNATSTGGIEANSDAALPIQLQILKTAVELLTGRKIHLFSMSGVPSGNTVSVPASTQTRTPSTSSSEPTFAFDYKRVTETSEQTNFSAAGKVVLTDGSTIDFSLQMSMERYAREETSVSIRSGAAAQTQDPLILSFGSGVHASGESLDFSLNEDSNTLPVLEGAAYLAIDRNGNGKVDDGSELFGPATGDGFKELAALDSDKNGWIDEADVGFSQLKLWQPDANGGGGAVGLKTMGVGALYLGHTSTPFTLVSASGETQAQVRNSGIYLNENGSAGALQQIDVVA